MTSATYSGLSCGRSYQLAVDAYDAAANRSARSAIVASTAPCPDTTPPSTPSGLTQTSSTETAIGLGWAPSTDNVGVAGYGVYLAGVRIATTSSPGYTLAALACATTYTVGVDAYDAAGSRSARATLVVATRGCPDRHVSRRRFRRTRRSVGFTQTSFTMSWGPATDNVGVTGYAVYLDGARIATTTATSYTYTGLTCGTTYTVGLEALDAAGNASDIRYATRARLDDGVRLRRAAGGHGGAVGAGRIERGRGDAVVDVGVVGQRRRTTSVWPGTATTAAAR